MSEDWEHTMVLGVSFRAHKRPHPIRKEDPRPVNRMRCQQRNTDPRLAQSKHDRVEPRLTALNTFDIARAEYGYRTASLPNRPLNSFLINNARALSLAEWQMNRLCFPASDTVWTVSKKAQRE